MSSSPGGGSAGKGGGGAGKAGKGGKGGNRGHMDEKCPICLEPIESDKLTLGCGHTFHGECLAGVLRGSKKQCPICRKPFNSAAFFDPSTILLKANQANDRVLRGGLDALAEFLRDPKTSPADPDAAAILADTVGAHRDDPRSLEFLPSLVTALRVHAVGGKYDGKTYACQRLCVALSRICKVHSMDEGEHESVPPAVRLLVEAGGVDPLVVAVQRHPRDLVICEPACHLFHAMSILPDRASLVAKGVLDVLILMIRELAGSEEYTIVGGVERKTGLSLPAKDKLVQSISNLTSVPEGRVAALSHFEVVLPSDMTRVPSDLQCSIVASILSLPEARAEASKFLARLVGLLHPVREDTPDGGSKCLRLLRTIRIILIAHRDLVPEAMVVVELLGRLQTFSCFRATRRDILEQLNEEVKAVLTIFGVKETHDLLALKSDAGGCVVARKQRRRNTRRKTRKN
jgi:hypothetical protein